MGDVVVTLRKEVEKGPELSSPAARCIGLDVHRLEKEVIDVVGMPAEERELALQSRLAGDLALYVPGDGGDALGHRHPSTQSELHVQTAARWGLRGRPSSPAARRSLDDVGDVLSHRRRRARRGSYGEHATESGVDNTDAQADEHGDAVDSEADGEADSTGNATAEQAREERDPPTDMPEPVPDFVSQLHQQIWDHLSGAELGEAIADLTPDEADNEGTEQSEQDADA